ncbi:MAG: hypothetical protein DI598_07740 [Pseudopedobacter saltans]|uniref:Import component protein n=1 Tax=Pseudopedobacter saltans TaxID=151895 RepID=A0A2W5EZP4_9SPHI|nr:MAG: hypothetical protein DI598_07740 [Pseudopedobacter saltans]
MENQTTPNVGTQDNGKTIAIVSYLFWLGWIIAFILNNGNKTSLGSYHIRQSLMLWIVSIIAGVASFILAFIPFVGGIISWVIYVGLFVLWIMGLINAINGQEKPIPVVGEKANEMLKGVA